MQFKQIAGQQPLKTKLTAMAVSGRVPHAQLVLGQSGAGNLPIALAFAAYLLCKNPLPDDSCGECDACRKMQTFTHPDLHFSFPFPSSSGDTCVDLYPQWRKALQAEPYLSYEAWMRLLSAENNQGNIPILECRALIRRRMKADTRFCCCGCRNFWVRKVMFCLNFWRSPRQTPCFCWFAASLINC